MEKSATLNLRINPIVKRNAEAVLSQLGMPISTAIDIYLKQIAMVGGIPFQVRLPLVPREMNAELMTDEELVQELEEGYQEAVDGKVYDAASAFAAFRAGKRV